MSITAKNYPAPELVPVRSALISVSDKNGIVEFARQLQAMGVELVSTGGTYRLLSEQGIDVLVKGSNQAKSYSVH